MSYGGVHPLSHKSLRPWQKIGKELRLFWRLVVRYEMPCQIDDGEGYCKPAGSIHGRAAWLRFYVWNEWGGHLRCRIFGPDTSRDTDMPSQRVCRRCGYGPYAPWHEKWLGLWSLGPTRAPVLNPGLGRPVVPVASKSDIERMLQTEHESYEKRHGRG